MVNNFLRQLEFALLPGHCLLCRRPSHWQGDICQDCSQDLPWLEPACHRCALPLPSEETASLCGQCQKSPPHFSRCFAAWEYGFPVDHLITDFKHHRRFSAGRCLGELWLHRCGPAAMRQPPELLLPVPLHWRRRWQRGFNQSLFITEQLSNILNIPISHTLRRQRHTPAQQQLSAKERKRNLKNAFCLHHANTLQGKHLAVIDDVLTTGATADAIAKLLLTHGAKRVDIWCLARTP